MQLKPWILTTFMQICLVVESLHLADKIVSLPGQPNVDFQQFSGYITVDEKKERALFYYFVEAETDPSSKPLVLWLNGGPGCSSVGLGAFVEHGPFKPDGQNLIKNEYSWNKEANMLYLESPAGVGFSYSVNKSFYADVNDEITARDNLAFLEHWFIEFPEFKNRDLYITGESYGGHYVPQLTQLIIDSKSKFNLKGVAIGNPLLEFDTDLNSRAEFSWSHGLISDSTYEISTTKCNLSRFIRDTLSGHVNLVCLQVWTKVITEISVLVNAYDVTLDVCLSSALSQSKMLDKLLGTENIDVCVEEKTVKYLNRKDVQSAFHAQLVGVTKWTACSDPVIDPLKYDLKNLETPTINVLGTIVEHGIRVLVYSGDQDSVISLTGTRTLVTGLAKKLGLNTTAPYRVWIEGRQVAGWTQVYGDNLSYATIRGASHEAPFSQPARALVLFKSFLAGKPLPEP